MTPLIHQALQARPALLAVLTHHRLHLPHLPKLVQSRHQALVPANPVTLQAIHPAPKAWKAKRTKRNTKNN